MLKQLLLFALILLFFASCNNNLDVVSNCEPPRETQEYIKEDEYVEVTPHHLRLRKITLDHLERKRENRE